MNKELTLDNLVKYGVITQEKADIIGHKAQKVILIGSKNSGKTFLAFVGIVMDMFNNKQTHALGFRKYKTNASDKMSSYFGAAVGDIERALGNLGTFKATGNIVQRIWNNKNKLKNQWMKFGSLEDVSGATDGTRPAFGYIANVIIDEAVIRGDMVKNQIPTMDEWKQDMEIITDNLQRNIATYQHINPGVECRYREYYTLNPWPGKHPLIQQANAIFPEEKFIDFLFGYKLEELLFNEPLIERQWDVIRQRLLTNHTMSIYDENSDTLVSRNTKFANPTMTKQMVNMTMNSIRESLIDGQINELTIKLGIESVPEDESNMLVYDITDKEYEQATTTFDELLSQGYLPKKINYSVDVDTSRVFTIATAVLMEKKAFFDPSERESKIYIPPIFELKAVGTGQYGELNEQYAIQVAKYIDKDIVKYYTLNKDIYPTIVIDDKRKWYLWGLKKLNIAGKHLTLFKGFGTFDQHGIYEIIARQDWFADGIRNGVLKIDKKNYMLIDDMKNCIRANINSTKRETKGSINYLDRIDAVENAWLRYLKYIVKAGK